MSCELPVIDPFHPSVMKFISETTDPECPGKPHGELVDGVLKFTGKSSINSNKAHLQNVAHNPVLRATPVALVDYRRRVSERRWGDLLPATGKGQRNIPDEHLYACMYEGHKILEDVIVKYIYIIIYIYYYTPRSQCCVSQLPIHYKKR